MRAPILLLMAVAGYGILQEPPLKKATEVTMKMNAGVTTTQLKETKKLYKRVLNCSWQRIKPIQQD